MLIACACFAQGVDPTGRPVAEVRVTGVRQVDPQLVLNQVRVSVGDPYDPEQVAQDIRNITRLGRFVRVSATTAQTPDGSIILTYVVEEEPLLADVQVVGNKKKNDQTLMGLVLLRGGDPRSDFLIQRGAEQIAKAYRDSGYFLVDVSVDQETLDESAVLVYRIREGPRVRVRGMEFEGNTVYSDKELKSKIETRKYIFIFSKGVLSEEQLDKDVARLREFYQQRGYLDVRVGRRITLSDRQDNAVVNFVIEEGAQYTVGQITFNVLGPGVFSEAMLREAMPLKTGDVFSTDKLRDTTEALRNLYGKLGYLSSAQTTIAGVQENGSTNVNIQRVFEEGRPTVNMIVNVEEGQAYIVGDVIVRGNQLTQDRVARRQIRGLEPGRPYDRTGLEYSRRRIRETGLFTDAKITVQGEPDEEVRDMLVEVREARTGSISFGAAVSSDAGVLGSFDLTQRNFDIADWPESFSELISGRAFRGAGQQFSLSLQPGDELQRYSVSWSDPYLFDSDYFVSTRGQFFSRVREQFDEERLGAFVRFGKRFGDVWSAWVGGRAEEIDIQDIDSSAPVDVFEVAGESTIRGISLGVSRATVDSRIFPTRGTRVTASIEHVGLGGDYDFNKFSAEANAFFTLDEDFFGRKTVLSVRAEIGYILEDDEAPLFERFYAGGHSSFRGFEYRGVGPRGLVDPDGMPGSGDEFIGDDPVGGEWLFLLGAEYNYPIWEEFIRGVFFIDSGTVQEDVGIEEWRVSIGAGIRLNLPIFGQAPFAFDLAYPLLKEEGDEERLFSFSIALPF